MSKKIIFVIVIILVVVGFFVYQVFIKKEKPAFELIKVERGNISQEVSETGQVKMGEEINLGFKTAGRIEKIYVKVGDRVEASTTLAKLDTSQLSIQLQEAQAALEVAQAELDKLLAGATLEEIKIAETDVENAQIALDTAQENLESSYQDALNTLDESYLKAYNASNKVSSIQRTYFSGNNQEDIRVKQNKDKINNALSQAKSYLDVAKDNPENENINVALSEMKKALKETYDALGIIREICEGPVYRNIVSSTNKTSLDTHRTNINTAITNVTNSQQTISSMKLETEAAEGQLQKAEDELALVIAEPRPEDIDLYQAQVTQAQAQVNLLKTQIEEAKILSPVAGEITEINKRGGEMVQPALAEGVISFLPASPFQIEVDIYEEDIVKIKVGNPVEITLVAFPEKTFKGKVISIDPAEKLIENVVYYEVTIDPVRNEISNGVDFKEIEKWLKPGMTADVVIKTASKENVLIIPEEAIQKKDEKTIIQVLKNGIIEDREIEIGLKGSDDLVEVISGLEEGEEIIIR